LKKLFLALLAFQFIGGMILGQTPKAVPSKSSIKVTYPNEGKVVIISTSCLILWQRTGIQNNKARIVLLKSTGEKVMVIAAAANNTGKYAWTVPYSIPMGSYRIRVKAGSIANMGATFQIKTPTFTPYVPHLNETWTDGTVKKIRWQSANATGLTAYIILGWRTPVSGWQGAHTLTLKVPADQNEYDWVVGKWADGARDLWSTQEDLSKYIFQIGVGLQNAPVKYNYMGFGPEFYIEKE
jgi:hypothetical protein